MKRRAIYIFVTISVVASFFLACFLLAQFPRPNYESIKESGLDRALVYAVIKAESNFDERAKSNAGAVGLMQLLPSTAQFICEKMGVEYDEERLYEEEYNVFLGCSYLSYLFTRFEDEDAVIAAYNAGEGSVCKWLKEKTLSPDGVHLQRIPYPETEHYVKKIKKFRKFYQFFGN